MINAKQELLDHLRELLYHISDNEVKYVSVTLGDEYSKARKHVEGTLVEVLPQLDFDYDSGYGRQYLYGTIWYKDGTWSDRDEYDGSEWWAYRKCPELPEGAKISLVSVREGMPCLQRRIINADKEDVS